MTGPLRSAGGAASEFAGRMTLSAFERLPAWKMRPFRGKLLLGGVPVFVLTEGSCPKKPERYLLVRDRHDFLWRVTTP